METRWRAAYALLPVSYFRHEILGSVRFFSTFLFPKPSLIMEVLTYSSLSLSPLYENTSHYMAVKCYLSGISEFSAYYFQTVLRETLGGRSWIAWRWSSPVSRAIATKHQNPRLLQIYFDTFRHWKATLFYYKTRVSYYPKSSQGTKNRATRRHI